jgi:cytochrome c553
MAVLIGALAWPLAAVAPARAAGAEDYATFCASCHGGERTVLRKIRRWPAADRRARLARFLESHYCGGDRELAASIAGHLDGLARGR